MLHMVRHGFGWFKSHKHMLLKPANSYFMSAIIKLVRPPLNKKFKTICFTKFRPLKSVIIMYDYDH